MKNFALVLVVAVGFLGCGKKGGDGQPAAPGRALCSASAIGNPTSSEVAEVSLDSLLGPDVRQGYYRLNRVVLSYDMASVSARYVGSDDDLARYLPPSACQTANAPKSIHLADIDPDLAVPHEIDAQTGLYTKQVDGLSSDTKVDDRTYLAVQNLDFRTAIQKLQASGAKVKIYKAAKDNEMIVTIFKSNPKGAYRALLRFTHWI